MKKILSSADTRKIIGASKFNELQSKHQIRFVNYNLSLSNNNVLWVW